MSNSNQYRNEDNNISYKKMIILEDLLIMSYMILEYNVNHKTIRTIRKNISKLISKI